MCFTCVPFIVNSNLTHKNKYSQSHVNSFDCSVRLIYIIGTRKPPLKYLISFTLNHHLNMITKNLKTKKNKKRCQVIWVKREIFEIYLPCFRIHNSWYLESRTSYSSKIITFLQCTPKRSIYFSILLLYLLSKFLNRSLCLTPKYTQTAQNNKNIRHGYAHAKLLNLTFQL